MKRISIIGSTGSVGKNTLKVVDYLNGQLDVVGLAARSSIGALAAQVARYHPRMVAIGDDSLLDQFHQECRALGIQTPDVVGGARGLRSLAEANETDVVVSAAVGAVGLEPTYAALAAGKTVALANKEAMVVSPSTNGFDCPVPQPCASSRAGEPDSQNRLCWATPKTASMPGPRSIAANTDCGVTTKGCLAW